MTESIWAFETNLGRVTPVNWMVIPSYSSVLILKVQWFIFSFWLIRKKFSLTRIFIINEMCFAIESVPVCRRINAILGFEFYNFNVKLINL